jgi:hypothetical protein
MKKTALVMAAGIIALSACAATPVAILPDGTPVVGRSFTPIASDPSVTIECVTGEEGSLTLCKVVSETPAGQGYGEMLLATVEKGRVDRTAEVGKAVRFTMRVRR